MYNIYRQSSDIVLKGVQEVDVDQRNCHQRRKNYERKKESQRKYRKLLHILCNISTYQTSIEYVMCFVAPDSAPWLLLLLRLYGVYNVIQKDDLKRSIGINMKTNDGKSIN